MVNNCNFETIEFKIMFRFLTQLGRYVLLLKKVFSKPEKRVVYYKQTMREFVNLGLTSIGIIAIISFFMGAVITLQTAYNTENPIYPKYLIGLGCRDSMILEFSSTIAALILAGKVGSNIAAEIGTMRVTEQIDALEIMGINSASYLILPKIIATLLFNPILTLIAIIVGIFGGWNRRYSFRCYYFREFHIWNSICLHSLLYHLLPDKNSCLCIYHNQCFSLPGLLCRRRIP